MKYLWHIIAKLYSVVIETVSHLGTSNYLRNLRRLQSLEPICTTSWNVPILLNWIYILELRIRHRVNSIWSLLHTLLVLVVVLQIMPHLSWQRQTFWPLSLLQVTHSIQPLIISITILLLMLHNINAANLAAWLGSLPLKLWLQLQMWLHLFPKVALGDSQLTLQMLIHIKLSIKSAVHIWWLILHLVKWLVRVVLATYLLSTIQLSWTPLIFKSDVSIIIHFIIIKKYFIWIQNQSLLNRITIFTFKIKIYKTFQIVVQFIL